MLGAIAGDTIGSVHEFVATKATDFPLFVAQSQFTDDTVLTVAVADCLLTGSSCVDKFHDYTRAYPKCGYGLRFLEWVNEGRREPYNSWGNGSAMRVSPVAFAFDTLEGVVKQARATAEVTHNHPEGIRGAEATAAATFDTVPQAITAFLESEDYEDAIRLAISLGGDADTLASITGGIAGAFYGGVPQHIAGPASELLDNRCETR